MSLILNSLEDSVGQVMDQLIEDVRASQKRRGQYASGRSARSLHRVTIRKGALLTFQMRGAAHWKFQQNGRGPTRSRSAGSPTLVEALREWAKDKGIQVNVYALARRIHKEGIKVPNRFNDGKVLSDPLATNRVTGMLKTAIRPQLIQSIRSQLFNS